VFLIAGENRTFELLDPVLLRIVKEHQLRDLLQKLLTEIFIFFPHVKELKQDWKNYPQNSTILQRDFRLEVWVELQLAWWI